MDNLTAAIPTDSGKQASLSSEEFRNLLGSWFEEKGIVSELKSHLRYRMINILKNTTIGRDLSRKCSQKTSLSRQAVNLIVAEYLMQNNYHYSLSIFNTEAGLSDIFPSAEELNGSSPAKFDPDNIRNILELIGVQKTNILCNDLLNSYYTDPYASILSSLINLLHYFTDKKCSDDKLNTDQYLDLDDETNFIKQIGGIFSRAKLSPEDFNTAIQNVKLCYNVEIKDLEYRHEKLVTNLRTEQLIIEEKLREAQNSKRLIERKMIKLAREYKALKSHVEGIVKDELSKDQNVPKTIEAESEERLKDRDYNVNANFTCNLRHSADRCEENPVIIQGLRKENCDLKAKRINRTFACNLKHCTGSCDEKTAILQELTKENRYLKVTKENPTSFCNLHHCTEKCDENTAVIKNLRKENSDLKEISEKRSEEILSLSSKYNELMKDFIDCQNRISLLNTKVNEGSHYFSFDSTSLEDKLIFSKTPDVSSEESSESVTEKLLKETRMRLKILEEESKAIDESYRMLQQGIGQINL